MRHFLLRGIAAAMLAAVLPASANAIPSLTVSGWRLGLANNSDNTVGVLSGEQFVFGAGSVVSSAGGISGHATTSSGKNFPIPFAGTPQLPNGYIGRLAYGPNASLTNDTW